MRQTTNRDARKRTGQPVPEENGAGQSLTTGGERQHYIDNLRHLCILLLFPIHTFMIWNDFGTGFYIWLGENKLLSTVIAMVNPWFMPLLFVLAGMSAGYALERRTVKEFIRQRSYKLLVPLAVGILLLVPLQTLYARVFFEQYRGNLLEHWKYFFTHFTDLRGYDGAFSLGQFWFILFLYIISMASLVLFKHLPRQKVFRAVEKMPAWGIALFFVPVWLMYYIGNFGGYSIGKCLALYLLGYYVLGSKTILEKLDKKLNVLLPLSLAGAAASGLLYFDFSYYGDLWVCWFGWNTLLVLLILGRRYMDRQTGCTKYMNKASYPIYILHQTILVAAAYYTAKIFSITAIQAAVICTGSFVLTLLAYHVITIGDD